MSTDLSFEEFIRRIRAGDEQAAVELVRQYEPAIRMEVRLHMHDPSLRRVFDSLDVCQSVLGSFFVRVAAGQYDLNEPRQLLRLLVAMARNKVLFQVRKQHFQRRDTRRTSAAAVETVARGENPEQIVVGKELLGAFRQRLSEEELQLADLRTAGAQWGEIAAKLGGTAQGRRKQLTRAVDRVARQLGLDEGHGE
jgi:DNA-directed RNA polymerase specialized sigma24 family protein